MGPTRTINGTEYGSKVHCRVAGAELLLQPPDRLGGRGMQEGRRP
jgi:hypothetical protein